MAAHASPVAEQSCHCSATSRESLATLSFTPSVSPSTAVPVIEGGVAGTGFVGVSPGAGSAGGGGAGADTAAVASDATEVAPPAPVAVTTTRMPKPTSSPPGTYVSALAPSMSTQADPSVAHRCQRRVIATSSLHVPSLALSSAPAIGSPATAGGARAVGGTAVGAAGAAAGLAATTSDAVEAARPVPTAPVALTRITSVDPTSSGPTT